ncbi:MAG: ABC transporter ATP-binding protein [Deltaproteobacteria bacterium]
MTGDAPNPVVTVEGVSKSYPVGFWRRRVRVLSDLSFRVARNEIVGFLGPNGAGKTTTIKILNRLAFPDGGRVTVFGEEAGSRPEIRRRIGFMPEQPYFYEYLTGLEFLSLCGHLNSMSRAAIRERSRAILSRVGLDGAGEVAIRKYSKGMMQRLGLAQALLHDPELVILDEPMSGLDPMGRMEVRNLIRELKASGKTVFFSSHIISDVEALCDRVIMLHRGRKVAEGRLDEMVGTGGVRYVEMVFSPVPSESWLAAAGFPEGAVSIQSNSLLLRAADSDEADEWIGRLRSAGSRLLSCVPVKRHLEDIYVERMGTEDPGGDHAG